MTSFHALIVILHNYKPNGLKAITRYPAPETLDFQGSLTGLQVCVLVNIDGSNNIIPSHLVSHFHLPTDPILSFPVMVGNGDHLVCSGFCPTIFLIIQNHHFSLPMYILCNISDCRFVSDSHTMTLHVVTLHSTSLLFKTLHRSESFVGSLF